MRDASVTITRNWPAGSRRRGCGARDSGTNSAVSAIAATPTGMFTQKIPRQPTEAISAPPTTGPSARLTPKVPPHRPIARARSARSVNVLTMMDIATGLSIEPPIACSIRNATSQPRPGARLHSSEPRVNAASPVAGRAREHQEAGQDQRVRVDGPLQPRDGGVQVALDGGERDVHDRVVEGDDDQAHAADGQDEQSPPSAWLRLRLRLRLRLWLWHRLPRGDR